MIARALFAFAIAVLLVSPLAGQEEGKAKPKETAEQKLVRDHLRENLPTGKWEEIKWWGPKRIKNGDNGDGPLAVRLKFRAANEMGGMTVYDDVFIFLKDNTVQRRGPSTAVNSNKERIFGK